MKAKKAYKKGGVVTGAKTKKDTSGMSPMPAKAYEIKKKREQEQIERSVRESRRAKRINESEARRAKARPDYKPKKKLEEGLRDDDGRILTAKKLRRNDVTKLETTSPEKKLKKSKAVIPVPTKKEVRKSRRRRNRK